LFFTEFFLQIFINFPYGGLKLSQESDSYIIGMVVQAEGLMVQVEASQANVLLLNWRLPGGSMQDLLSDIRRLQSPPKIVVLSVNPIVEEPALSAGAYAFISKSAPPDELLG